eukprot:GHVR01146839.1.p1 GENE.GHVR01146839.1~~GHVR01146839.1.p1  ORF type:complete len:564 (+),score=91.82 GHVR01146839.1:828-2519(+)
MDPFTTVAGQSNPPDKKKVVYLIRLTHQGLLFEPLCYQVSESSNGKDKHIMNERNDWECSDPCDADSGTVCTRYVAASSHSDLMADAHSRVPIGVKELCGQGVDYTDFQLSEAASVDGTQPAYVIPFRVIRSVQYYDKNEVIPEESGTITNLPPKSTSLVTTAFGSFVGRRSKVAWEDRSAIIFKHAQMNSDMEVKISVANLNFKVFLTEIEGGVNEVLPHGVHENINHVMPIHIFSEVMPIRYAEELAGMPPGWSCHDIVPAKQLSEKINNTCTELHADPEAAETAMIVQNRLAYASWGVGQLMYHVLLRDHALMRTASNSPSRTRLQRWFASALTWFGALMVSALFFGSTPSTGGVINDPFFEIKIPGQALYLIKFSLRILISMVIALVLSIPFPLFCDIMWSKRVPYLDDHAKSIKSYRPHELAIFLEDDAPWIMNEARRKKWIKKERRKEWFGYVAGTLFLVWCGYYLMMFALTSNFSVENSIDYVVANTASFILDYIIRPIFWCLFLVFLIKAALRTKALDPIVNVFPQSFDFTHEKDDNDGLADDDFTAVLASGFAR